MATNAELATRLHERGLRMTPQRRQVLDAVRELEHATPEQVSSAVPEIDVTTVYRTLELLEELDVLRHTHLGHGAASFRLASDDHVHVVCHSCGGVIDVPDDLIDSLSERLRVERGFTVDRSHFTVFGRCGNCAARIAAEHAPRDHGAPEHGAPEHGAPEHGTHEHGTHEHGAHEHGARKRQPEQIGASAR